MEGNQEYKKTEGHGRTRVTRLLPPDHPIVQGVMEAKQILDGAFPDHVGSIRITPDTKPGHGDKLLYGECEEVTGSASRITIYGGSIMEHSSGFMARANALKTTLHEIGHSVRIAETRAGAWLDTQPSTQWEELDAEEFVDSSFKGFYKKRRLKRPRQTWGQLCQARKNLNGKNLDEKNTKNIETY